MDIAKTCLVIDARKLEALWLDGPALRVRMQAQNSRLFPLRRLSRIHVLGALNEGLDALLHCAERQIPVAFFTIMGKLRCQLYFPAYENSILSHWLEHVDFDPEAKEQYDEWLAFQSLHVLSMMQFTKGSSETRWQLAAETLRGAGNKFLGAKVFNQALDWLNGMLNAQVSQLIVQHGLSNQSRGKRRLMEDITPVCEVWLLYLFLDAVASAPKFNVNAYSMSNFYQRNSEQIEYTARRMLSQLATRLEAII